MKKLVSLLILFSFSQLLFAQVNKENIASTWINSNVQDLKVNQSFDMLNSRPGRSGETFRYYHTVNGVEVFESSIAIHVSNNNKVTYTSSTFDSSVETINTTPTISEDDALNSAISALEIEGAISQKEIKLYVYNKLEDTRLVYRVTTMSEFLIGHWETIVDAKTNEVLSTRDIAIYENREVVEKKVKATKRSVGFLEKSGTTSIMVDGTALVFDPDPLTKTTSIYGAPYSDNNDATNDELDAARTAVTLYDIAFDGSFYLLSGPYVEIAELDAPSTGLFTQDSPDFNFTRNEQGFEAANCYHHIDKTMRFINDDLGIPLVSLYNGGVIRFDPHGFNGADNSFYSAGSLVFGEGGVDDAEDMDVIIHELGHGLHDWVTNGSLSQVQGLSEGTGDYFANSYKRSLGFWDSSDDSYYNVFGWDGHNPFWPGRRTNYSASYPGGLTGSIHTDGQIWSSTLLEVWEVIGREKTDSAVLEGLAMTNGGTNQQSAAIAVRQAAIDMNYSCDDIAVFTEIFEARGYILPDYTCDPDACSIANIDVSNMSECDDNGTTGEPSDDIFTADVTVTFVNPADSGTLDLTGDGTASVSVSGLTSPHTFVGVEFSADGNAIDLTVSFSEEGSCSFNESNAGTAPESCSTLGINDPEDLNSISLYPNPAKNSITLSNITKEYAVTIFNLLGQKVKEQHIDANNSELNISNLTIGTYLLKIEGYNNILRFIKE